jgi:hypothetical protein
VREVVIVNRTALLPVRNVSRLARDHPATAFSRRVAQGRPTSCCPSCPRGTAGRCRSCRFMFRLAAAGTGTPLPSARPHRCRSARRRPSMRRRPASPAVLIAVPENAVTGQRRGTGRLTCPYPGDQDLGIPHRNGGTHSIITQLMLLNAITAGGSAVKVSRAEHHGPFGQ